jgi:hypothetical protein
LNLAKGDIQTKFGTLLGDEARRERLMQQGGAGDC